LLLFVVFRFAEVHNGIVSAVEKAIEQHCEGKGFITMRITHVYSGMIGSYLVLNWCYHHVCVCMLMETKKTTDGLAPYYSVIAKGKNGKQLEQWDAIKHAASEAILRFGVFQQQTYSSQSQSEILTTFYFSFFFLSSLHSSNALGDNHSSSRCWTCSSTILSSRKISSLCRDTHSHKTKTRSVVDNES
jgi:hypothetical protein